MSLNDDLFQWNKDCLDCTHCKTRVFRSYPNFLTWLEQREIIPKPAWRRRFREDFSKAVSVYWCGKDTKKKVYVTKPGPQLKNKEKCWYGDNKW